MEWRIKMFIHVLLIVIKDVYYVWKDTSQPPDKGLGCEIVIMSCKDANLVSGRQLLLFIQLSL